MSSFGTFPPFRGAGPAPSPIASTQQDMEAPPSVSVYPPDPPFRNSFASERPFPPPSQEAPLSVALDPTPPSVSVNPAEPTAFTLGLNDPRYSAGTSPSATGLQFRSAPTFPNAIEQQSSSPQWRSMQQTGVSNYPGSLSGSLPPPTLQQSAVVRESVGVPQRGSAMLGYAKQTLHTAEGYATSTLHTAEGWAKPIVQHARAELSSGFTTKRKFALMHVSFLLAIFIPPLMLCINLGLNNNFRYFLGSWPLISIFVLLFIALVPWIDMRWRPRSWWFLGSVWIIAAFFTLISGFTRGQTHTVMAALDNQDCYGFTEKRNLQRAYAAVSELNSQCRTHEQFYVGVKECPGYDDLLHDWGKEVLYLEALENQFPCAGICHESPRVWSSVGTSAPACGLFVGQWIYGAYIQCMIVFWYSIFIILAAYIVNELMQPFLQEYWEPLVSGNKY